MQSREIARYTTLDVLGRGTVGVVYRALDRETRQEVALKLLTVDIAEQPDIERRFIREVGILQRFKHPNIIEHIDCGLYEGGIYVALELVECGTLLSVLEQRKRLPWQDAVAVAIQICDALTYAHQHQVVHRDLKPGNLFLSIDGLVKLGDFGIALDQDATRLTLDGLTVGTVRYMSPEQITGAPIQDGQVDLYALGCMLYEMLCGVTPFDGARALEVAQMHLTTEPQRISERVAGLPTDLVELTGWLLEKEPFCRPGGAAHAKSLLEGIRDGKLMLRPDQPAAMPPAPFQQTENLTERLVDASIWQRIKSRFAK